MFNFPRQLVRNTSKWKIWCEILVWHIWCEILMCQILYKILIWKIIQSTYSYSCVFLFSQAAWIKVETKAILTIYHHIITRNYRISLSHSDNRNFILQIRNVQESDKGGYMCQVNTVPMKSQVGYLDVLGEDFYFYLSYLEVFRYTWLKTLFKVLLLLFKLCFVLVLWASFKIYYWKWEHEPAYFSLVILNRKWEYAVLNF